MSRTLSYFAAFIGALCVCFIIHLFFFTHVRTARNDVIQDFLIGFGLAFASAQAYAEMSAVKVNGWITSREKTEMIYRKFARGQQALLGVAPILFVDRA